MSVQTTIYDVFLSYSLAEAEHAELVERTLMHAGLDVFNPAKLEPGSQIRDILWRALAESAALVLIVDPVRAPGSNVGVELGAAMAWHKPIYVVHANGGSTVKLPSYLREFPVYPMSRVEDIALSVKRGLTALSEEERALLASVYIDLGIPLDKLLVEPTHVDALGQAFNRRCPRHVTGERLVQELVRLRKGGQLARLPR